MSRLREELRHKRALDAESDAQGNVRFIVE